MTITTAILIIVTTNIISEKKYKARTDYGWNSFIHGSKRTQSQTRQWGYRDVTSRHAIGRFSASTRSHAPVAQPALQCSSSACALMTRAPRSRFIYTRARFSTRFAQFGAICAKSSARKSDVSVLPNEAFWQTRRFWFLARGGVAVAQCRSLSRIMAVRFERNGHSRRFDRSMLCVCVCSFWKFSLCAIFRFLFLCGRGSDPSCSKFVSSDIIYRMYRNRFYYGYFKGRNVFDMFLWKCTYTCFRILKWSGIIFCMDTLTAIHVFAYPEKIFSETEKKGYCLLFKYVWDSKCVFNICANFVNGYIKYLRFIKLYYYFIIVIV